MPHFRVYIGRSPVIAVPTTLREEFDYRKYGAAEPSYVAAASDPVGAKRLALRYVNAHPADADKPRVDYRGPKAAVPVIVQP